MRLIAATFLSVFALTFTVSAQEKKGGAQAPPKNLKVLPADTDVRTLMVAYRVALGVACTYCHVTGDFASDDNPKKEPARMMIRMVNDINSKFADGKAHVSCWTCHHGKAKPEMAAPPAPAQ